jgi:hypothetical protein
MRLQVVGLLCLFVTACMSLPLPGPPSNPKPASDVANTFAVTPRDGVGVVMVTRDRQLRDMDCTYDISLDGELVAGLREGERVTIYADPGDRVVGISIRVAEKCDPAVAQVPVQVVASATTKIRVKAEGYYHLKVEATTF